MSLSSSNPCRGKSARDLGGGALREVESPDPGGGGARGSRSAKKSGFIKEDSLSLFRLTRATTCTRIACTHCASYCAPRQPLLSRPWSSQRAIFIDNPGHWIVEMSVVERPCAMGV